MNEFTTFTFCSQCVCVPTTFQDQDMKQKQSFSGRTENKRGSTPDLDTHHGRPLILWLGAKDKGRNQNIQKH